MRASFIYHQITAVISILATLFFLFALYREELTSYAIAIGLLIVSISWGVHALVHFAEEYIYGFEPVSGDTTIHDRPIR